MLYGPCVETTNADRSLFDVIQEIEERDYIVVEDSCGIKGIVTASDLANRFERFSRAFAYIGEIELRLREFIERKGICIEKPQSPPDGWVLGLPDCIKALKSDQGIKALKHSLDDPKHFICEVRKVNSIRNRVMHFKDGRLDEATDKDINTLETALKKIKTF